MDHRVTRIEQIEIGDILELYSNVNVSPQYPHGWRQHVLLTGRVPKTNSYTISRDPEVLMDNVQLTESDHIYVDTSGSRRFDVRVTNKTSRFITVDVTQNDGSVELANLIMTKDNFEWTLLRHTHLWSCYKKQTNNPWWYNPLSQHGENPHGASTGEEDEEAVNPPASIPQSCSPLPKMYTLESAALNEYIIDTSIT